MSAPRYLYHVTDKAKVPSILAEGIRPLRGRNSGMVGETGDRVCLCTEPQARIWADVLGADAFLRVDTAGLPEPEHRDYDAMEEYLYACPVPPGNLSESMPDRDPEADAEACLGYVMTTSEVLVELFRHMDRKDPEPGLVEDMLKTVANLADILPRLPWHAADPDVILDALREEGEEGEYTMCDKFKDTGRRFWEMLRSDGYGAIERGPELADELEKRLGPGLRKLCTGGWDGWYED